MGNASPLLVAGIDLYKLVYNTFHGSNLSGLRKALVDPVLLNHSQGIIVPMGGEIFTAGVLSFTLILVGIGMGFLLLKIQGDKEENL